MILRYSIKTLPDEIYNLSAQSHVAVSFDVPEYTSNVDGLGTLRILEAIKSLKKKKKIKFYQAGTSEMFGGTSKEAQNEKTIFDPKSPYAASKVYAHSITKIYRDAYKIFASNGILFNHESERRSKSFVTRKISVNVAKIILGLNDKIYLGNIDSKRDWGYAPEFVEGMWRILQAEEPDDFVLSTNETHTVREFIEESFKHFDEEIIWEGIGIQEKGILKSSGKVVVAINPMYFRPTEVDILIGDYSKAKEKLGWEPKTKFKELVKIMVQYDYDTIKKTL